MRRAAADFLRGAGWDAAAATPIAGDASGRRYWRVAARGRTAVLMDAGRDGDAVCTAFAAIATRLRGHGMAAPAILADGTDRGLLLLEDLGDLTVARAAADPDGAEAIYAAAVDALVHLGALPPPPGLPRYGPAEMAAACDLAATAHFRISAALWQPVRDALRAALERHAAATDTLLHRDFHAENLFWLPARTGIARIGLIDFQDAVRGHPAYDLVSLLQDARRDVDAGLERRMIERHVAATGAAADAFGAAYAVLGVQRHLRILGVFARLAAGGRSTYASLVPRVTRDLRRDLAHPALGDLAAAMARLVPVGA